MKYIKLREPTFFILTSLASGRKHGYLIIKDAEELSGGRVTLKVGTLYAALERLETEGLVVRVGDEAVDGRLRRYFDLTDDGALALASEADRAENNAKVARKSLAARPATGKAAMA